MPDLETGSENHLGLTFSPDGEQAFWVAWNGQLGSSKASQRIIYTSRRQHGKWSKPAPMPFTAEHSDSDPFVSPDGRWLYFVSQRPVNHADESTDGNIWRYCLAGEYPLERLSINSPEAEYSPVITGTGTLYFASSRDGGPGQGDLYVATPIGERFSEPRALGAALNSPTGEWNLWVSEDEQDLIFEASSRVTNVSVPGDLYYSWRRADGWQPAVPIVSLNTPHSDLMPRLHPDGNVLYFTRAPIGGQAGIVSISWPTLRATLRAGNAGQPSELTD